MWPCRWVQLGRLAREADWKPVRSGGRVRTAAPVVLSAALARRRDARARRKELVGRVERLAMRAKSQVHRCDRLAASGSQQRSM